MFLIRTIFGVLVIGGYSFSQQITFVKRLPVMGHDNNNIKAYETVDSNYIAAGYSDNYSALIKHSLQFVELNTHGKIVFQKTLDTLYGLHGVPVLKLKDEGYLITSAVKNNEQFDLKVIRLDSKKNTIWQKEFGYTERNEIGIRSIEIPDSGFYVYSTDDQNKLCWILRLNTDGTLLWQKELNLERISSFFYQPYLATGLGANLVIADRDELLCFNQYGDSLWDTNISGIKGLDIQGDSLLYIVTGNELFRVTDGGEIKFNMTLAGNNFNAVAALSNGSAAVLGIESENTILQVFDETGMLQLENNFPYPLHYITQTTDEGFLLSGLGQSGAIIIKTDQLGNYYGLEFGELSISYYQPGILSAYQYAPIFHDLIIQWYTDNVEFIDLSYSTNYGQTWLNIAKRYPADLNSFWWEIPETPADSCLLKIASSENSSISDQSDNPFSIIYYNDYDFFAANEIFMWIANNGDGSHDPRTDGNGFYWPGGEEAVKSAVFEDGLLYGGKINGEIRVNGNTHRQGMLPGIILDNGEADDPVKPEYQVFKIKKGWEYLPQSTERRKYEYNYFHWPGELGAPYVDLNNDGKYTACIDAPDYIGDEVLFYASNDMDSNRTKFTYGSLPIGLQFQTTVWGYDKDNFLKDVVFKKYRIINKSEKTINDMYLSYWTDDDLGDANDDYAGCDTLLNLGYTWNGDNADGDGSNSTYGISPPAVGHMLVQGPIIKSGATDSARYGSGWVKGFDNLPMTTFIFYIGANPTYRDPAQGNYQGSIEVYNYMQGKIWNGDSFIGPNTGEPTVFVLSGDPAEETGWYEGDGWLNAPTGGPGDRRYLLSSGPFNMAPGDTQEVVIAIFVAQGKSNVNSVTKLKEKAALIQSFYNNEMITSVSDDNISIPEEFQLQQNYPNPFNPTTKIKYTIPAVETGHAPSLQTSLIVYDILGREVATLLNEEKKPGKYEVNFDAEGLASGVYLYQLKAGEFISTKKMILLR